MAKENKAQIISVLKDIQGHIPTHEDLNGNEQMTLINVLQAGIEHIESTDENGFELSKVLAQVLTESFLDGFNAGKQDLK